MSFHKIACCMIALGFMTACDMSSSNSLATSAYGERVINGYIISAISFYDGLDNIQNTVTYTLDDSSKTIISTETSSNSETRNYFNESGYLARREIIAEGDPQNDDQYSSNSVEWFIAYNDLGLPSRRTDDYSLDGNINDFMEWEYDSEGYATKREHMMENGEIVTVTSMWEDGRKISKFYEYANGNVEEVTFQYDGSIYPVASSTDKNADGSIERTAEFEFDINGNPIEVKHFDENGSLYSRIELSYQSIGNLKIENFELSNWYYF